MPKIRALGKIKQKKKGVNMKKLIGKAVELLEKEGAPNFIWVEFSERERGGFFNSFEEGAETDDKAIYLRKFSDYDEYANFFGVEDLSILGDIGVIDEDEVVKELDEGRECLVVVEDKEIDEKELRLAPFIHHFRYFELCYLSYKFRMCGNIHDVYRHFEEALTQDSAMPVKIYKKEHALLQLKNAPGVQESEYLAEIVLKIFKEQA